MQRACVNCCVLLFLWPDFKGYILPLPGKEMVDYICQYLSNVRERRVTPDVQPGYMRALLPDSAPVEPDSWDNIFGDIEKIIMPGVRTRVELESGKCHYHPV